MTPSIKASRGETGGGWWDGGVARRSRGWGRIEGGRRPGGSMEGRRVMHSDHPMLLNVRLASVNIHTIYTDP
jgi:hypothetical protein